MLNKKIQEDIKMLARINRTNLDDFVNEYLRNEYKDKACYNQAGGTVPAVNILESEKGFEIEVAAPGLSRDDFKISLDNDLLSISADRKDSGEEGDNRYRRREFSYASFRRSFHIPKTVNTELIAAQHNDGILKISLPKKEEEVKKGPKQIEVA